VPVTLFGKFAYDTSRAEICCKIGYIYKKQNNQKPYALSLEKPKTWGFSKRKGGHSNDK
jgi:hypothetical protein